MTKTIQGFQVATNAGLLPRQPSGLNFSADFSKESSFDFLVGPEQTGRGVIATFAIIDASNLNADIELTVGGVTYCIPYGHTVGFPLVAASGSDYTLSLAPNAPTTVTGVAQAFFTDAGGMSSFDVAPSSALTAAQYIQTISGLTPTTEAMTTFAEKFVSGLNGAIVPAYASDVSLCIQNAVVGQNVWVCPASQQLIIKRAGIKLLGGSLAVAGPLYVRLSNRVNNNAGATYAGNTTNAGDVIIKAATVGTVASDYDFGHVDIADGFACGLNNSLVLYTNTALVSGEFVVELHGTVSPN